MTGPQFKEIALERLQLAAQSVLSTEFAETPMLRVVLDEWAHTLTMGIRQAVLGKDVERTEVKYPADWWQALRARWFPRWWLKRHPVKWTRIEMVARELYPRLSAPGRFGATIAVFQRASAWGDE